MEWYSLRRIKRMWPCLSRYGLVGRSVLKPWADRRMVKSRGQDGDPVSPQLSVRLKERFRASTLAGVTQGEGKWQPSLW